MVDQLPLFREELLQTEKKYDPAGAALQLRVTELPLLLTLVTLMPAGTVGAPRMKLPSGTGIP